MRVGDLKLKRVLVTRCIVFILEYILERKLLFHQIGDFENLGPVIESHYYEDLSVLDPPDGLNRVGFDMKQNLTGLLIPYD
jgi:hypothetical protein